MLKRSGIAPVIGHLVPAGVPEHVRVHREAHKSIQHTVRYTKLSPDRFRDFWRD
jgi:hypothetical protein